MPFRPPDRDHDTDASQWPTGVAPITWNDIGRLGVGPDARLHSDGEPVVVERRLVPSLPQKIWAAVFASAALPAGSSLGASDGGCARPVCRCSP